MSKLSENMCTALRNPNIILRYAGWLIRSCISMGEPVRNLHGVLLGDFNGFSEYHSVSGGIAKDELSFIQSYPFREGVIIDVGANLGLFSLLLNKQFVGRRVIAFEPNPSTFLALKKNMRRNAADRVECYQTAIADKEGAVTFSVREHARSNASISNDTMKCSAGEIRVPCTTLDAFCKAHGVKRIALLKVDVEGFEWLVFQGATTVFSQIRPSVIYFEVCPSLTRAAGFDAVDPAKYLFDRGYALNRLTRGGELLPVEVIGAAEVECVENWIAIDSR